MQSILREGCSPAGTLWSQTGGGFQNTASMGCSHSTGKDGERRTWRQSPSKANAVRSERLRTILFGRVSCPPGPLGRQCHPRGSAGGPTPLCPCWGPHGSAQALCPLSQRRNSLVPGPRGGHGGPRAPSVTSRLIPPFSERRTHVGSPPSHAPLS